MNGSPLAKRAKAARQGLRRDDHPVDLQTGRPVTAEEVAQRLAAHFDTLDQLAAEAGLSSQARARVAKARRVLDALQATRAFFWTMLAVWLRAWQLSAPVQQWMREDLIPGYYLQRVAPKAATAQERLRLRTRADEILARARSPDGLWGTFSPELRADLEAKAQPCADLFQRSSSCVEGGNGQLSLSASRPAPVDRTQVARLTVLHNYAVKRADGSTAAERFYGVAPGDLFRWLLKHLSPPARPRTARRAV